MSSERVFSYIAGIFCWKMDKYLWVVVWGVFMSYGLKRLVNNLRTKNLEVENLIKELRK